VLLHGTAVLSYHQPPDLPRKPLRKMPKSSTLSLAMRPKGGKETAPSPMSPLSPASPPLDGTHADLPTPNAPFRDAPQSPASPKLRKDSKSIFSNFSANKSSSRLNSPDKSSRQNSDTRSTVYTNGHSGGSTPDLSRPVQRPSTDGRSNSITALFRGSKANLADQRLDPADHDSETSKRADRPKKQSSMLSRSKSIKTDEYGRAKLNKAPPAKLSPDPTATWTHNGEGMPLKTAPLDKDKSWRGNIAFGKLRTHSADRHDSNQHVYRVDDNPSERRDRAEQNSVASNSFNDNKGAQLMANIGSGARKVGGKLDSARKGIFGKLGRSSSNHERELQVPAAAYQFQIIHTPLVEQTRLTSISNRLENSKDKTEFWMPALPWRCIE
jgi:hypothetical protein